jgi:transcriptional regulator with XRE-family HTH domain
MSRSLHHSQYSRLQQALITARQSAGLTQQQLASQLNKPQSFVAKVELGERRLDVVEFLVVCDALNVNPCDVLTQLNAGG